MENFIFYVVKNKQHVRSANVVSRLLKSASKKKYRCIIHDCQRTLIYCIWSCKSMCLTVFSIRGRCFKRNITGLKQSIWVPYKTDIVNFLADVIMIFLNIRRYLPRQFSRVDLSQKGCVSVQYIFKFVFKYSKYSDLNSFTQNAQLKISCLQKMKIEIENVSP